MSHLHQALKSYPFEWSNSKLEDLVTILDGKRVPINNTERQNRIEGKPDSALFPYYGATGEVGKIDDYIFDEELVALGEDGVPFLDVKKSKAYMLYGKTWVNNHAHVLKAIEGITTNKFILNYLNQFDYYDYVNGGTRLKLTQANMRKIPIPLPPLAEQQQIAAKLDELLAQVDNLKTRLDNIPKILKRFRQSVLAAAVSGKLTEDWRKEDILRNWLETNIGEVAIVSTGKTPMRAETDYWENGTVPWLTSTITGKEFCYEAEQFVTEVAVKKCTLKIFKSGTLLLAMYGEGKTRGQVTELKLSATCNQACAAIIVDENKALRSFIKLRLLENYEETRKTAAGGNQPNLNLNKVRDIPVLLPPIEEQTEIVARVEQLFTYADQIEQRVKDAQSRVNHLTQAILTKAFRGELTAEWRAQNPDLISGENSAEALLARIQEERETVVVTKKTVKKEKA